VNYASVCELHTVHNGTITVCFRWKNMFDIVYLRPRNSINKSDKLAPCRTDGRLFTTDVSAKFKVTWHKN